MVDRARERVVAVALAQAGTETWALRAAGAVRRSGGLTAFLAALTKLGRAALPRGDSGGSNRAAIAGRVIAATSPGGADTPAAFADAVEALGTPRGRLLELATFAPQWAEHIEVATQLPGLADLAWWWIAHANEDAWAFGRNDEERAWVGQITNRSAVPVERLVLGACDANWFHRAVASTPADALAEIFAAFRAGVTASGHKRALGYANALSGREPVASIVGRIESKREQLAVRALGLPPLPSGEVGAAVAERYAVLRRFLRERTQFGVQRQTSELREHFVVDPEALSEHGGALTFEGENVKFAQMRALLLGRDWRLPEFEKPRRLFPAAGITALLAFDGGRDGTPDSARPTIHDVRFERSADRSPVAADAVPPTVCSEAMRDVALVVAVAAKGGPADGEPDEETGLSPWTGRDW